MLTVLGGLAEFEGDLIRTRTSEGRERAKARGVKLGRKPKMTEHQKRAARAPRVPTSLQPTAITTARRSGAGLPVPSSSLRTTHRPVRCTDWNGPETVVPMHSPSARALFLITDFVGTLRSA
jgi:hypothetical protein